jgi:hypothetical protein
MLLKKWQALAAGWESVFAQTRTYQRVLALALGLLCGVGRRTITRSLGFWGKEQQDWSADYKVFSRSQWEAAELFDPVLRQGVERYCPADRPIAVALDDTVLPRTGKQVPNTSWQRDPMSPPFQVNLIWGQRFMQASVQLPLYQEDQESSPRALPVRFAECPVIRKPGKKATKEQQADYRRAKKQHNLSTRFVAVGQELRQRLDGQGFAARILLLTGDGSFCNRTTFRAQWDRTHLLCRARKDLSLCFHYQGPGRRFYGEKKFHPQEVYSNKRRKWKQARIFHGGRWRQVRYKEVKSVLWEGGARRKLLRLFVLAPTPYLKSKHGRRYYREKAFLLTDDLQTETRLLLQDYFDHFEIEFNHRDEKSILGVGQAQVWAEKSVPRVPELVVAGYSTLLLASLQAYGPKRTEAYPELPKWRRAARRPSCQDLVTVLRQQVDEVTRSDPQNRICRFEQMILKAAA